MLHYIVQFTHNFAHGAHLLRYVSVRSAAAFLTALLFSFMFANRFIEGCKRRFRVNVGDRPPKRHEEKNDTPTMGGLFILTIFVVNTLLWSNLFKPEVLLFLLCIISFGILGCVDDWAKIVYRKGISARTKFVGQVVIALSVMLIWYYAVQQTTELCVPFFKGIIPSMGWLVIPWGVFIIVGTSNAVNLTDGLDGLATGPLIFNLATFSALSYVAGHKYFAHYLHIPYAGTSEATIIGSSLVGALLGFLWYNTYPAQIFMGDVGSLALGAGLGLMTIMARQELLLPLAGGIFFVETISVIMQVISFRYFKKRIFRMAPLHHHFELLGWNEAKITIRFWIISVILCVISLITLKIR